MADTRIAIRDDNGVLRLVTRITEMRDGIAASVPYHSAKEGWLYKMAVRYDRTEYVSHFDEMIHYTAEDNVKLSIHLGGFVHFSSANKQTIRSGYDRATGEIKGIGIRSENPVRVTSGPLFGILVSGLEDFRELGPKKAMTFEKQDFWHHPRDCSASAKGYHLEFFMFDVKRLREVRMINGQRTLCTELPFESIVQFPFHLRVIEFPRLSVFLGVIVRRVTEGWGQSGFSMDGPSVRTPGKPYVSIGARYPRPHIITDGISLDYRPGESEAGAEQECA